LLNRMAGMIIMMFTRTGRRN